MNVYIEAPPKQIAAEKEYLRSAIFKLIPYKECNYEYIDKYFESVLQQLTGFNRISGHQPVMITIISLVEYARQEDNFTSYRKAILDACGMIKLIKESDLNA